MRYAVVFGEALIDLLEGECDGRPVYRRVIGGAPLNVAVGVARLGGTVEFAGSVGDDALAGKILDFLAAAGVGRRVVTTVAAPTTLAVASFAGAEPDFRFYGDPPSYGMDGAAPIDGDLLAGAAVLYCGSIVLLHPTALVAARSAWSLTKGLRVFDPNIRPRLLPDEAAWARQREIVAEFAATAHLVKLSAADADALYGETPEQVAVRLRALGARVVVVTRGAAGAYVAYGSANAQVPAPVVDAVDATGAGDSVMAALIADLLADGPPDTLSAWQDRVAYALRVAALVCESSGGADSMPTRSAVATRFPRFA